MFSSWLDKSKDHLPLTWWKQHPVYLSAVVALTAALSMVVYAIAGAPAMRHFAFSVEAVFDRWQIWTPLTYALVNPPSLWTLIGCYLLWSFGEAVERHLGRRAFVSLLAILLIVSPLLMTLVHLGGYRGVAAGIMPLEFGVFIAFATLYPRATINLIIVSIEAWVLAAVFVGINALQCLAVRDWSALLLLAGNVGAAYAFIRIETGDLTLASLPKRAPAAPRVLRPKAAKAFKSGKSNLTADDVLDKISREGMRSLTSEERRVLEQASEAMKRRK